MAKHPADGEAWLELAEGYQRGFSFGKALFCLEEVLLLQPESSRILMRIAEVLYTLGGPAQLRLAQEYLSYVFGKDRANLRALLMLIRVQDRLADNPDLLALLRRELAKAYAGRPFAVKL